MDPYADTYDPNRMVDPVKKQVMLRIQMEEEYETGEVDNLDENDPDVVLWRSLYAEDKVMELIAAKVSVNTDNRKFEKYKRYYLELAGPFARPRLLKLFRMPPEESPIVLYLKSAVASVSRLLISSHPPEYTDKDI